MCMEKVYGPSQRDGEGDAGAGCILERMRTDHWLKDPPLSPLWLDLKAKVRGLEMLPSLKDRLGAIETEFGRLTDKGKTLKLIEISRWKEAILNSETEPTAYDTPLPQSLLDDLDAVWQGRDWLEP